MTEYQRLDKNISLLERTGFDYPGPGYQLACSLSDRITWAYKWRRISQPQAFELMNRMTELWRNNK